MRLPAALAASYGLAPTAPAPVATKQAPASGDWQQARFHCCDTDWLVAAPGPRAADAVDLARREALRLESILNAFDARSAVATLNRDGRVTDPVVARVARRALELERRTEGVFSIQQGRLEHELKAFIRGGPPPAAATAANPVRVEGDTVLAAAPVDLNGIAKGWMADRVAETLEAAGAPGFVDAGGDIARPRGRVHIDAPGHAGPAGGSSTYSIATLQTTWNIATSGTTRRQRDGLSHLYDPRTGRVAAHHEQVTVVAREDCALADVLATVLCVLPSLEALAVAQRWPDVEAMFVAHGRVWWTTGFEDHVA